MNSLRTLGELTSYLYLSLSLSPCSNTTTIDTVYFGTVDNMVNCAVIVHLAGKGHQ